MASGFKIADAFVDVTANTTKAAAAIAAIPALASMATGLALASVPLLFAGIGIAAAAQNEKVKASYTGLKDHVVKETQRLAAPIVPVLMNISTQLKSTFAQISPMLSTIFIAIAPMIQTLADGFRNFITNVMPAFTRVIQGAGPIVGILADGLGKIGTAIGGFFDGLMLGMPGAQTGLTSLFTIIGGLLPALGQMLGALANIGGTILTALMPHIMSLIGFLTTMATWINNNQTAVIAIITAIGAFAAILQVIKAGILIFNGIMTVIRIATVAYTAVQWLLNAAMLANPIGIIVILLAALVAAVIIAWKNSETFRNIVLAVWSAIKAGISNAVNVIKGILNWFGELPGRIAGWFGAAKDWAVRKMGELVSWLAGLPGRILSAVGNLGSLLVNAGRNIIQGLWNGIQGMGSWLYGQISGFVKRVVPGPILSFLGIHSPSRWMRDEVGKMIPAGLAEGINAASGLATNAAAGLASDVAGASLVSSKYGGTSSGAGGLVNGAGGIHVENLTLQIAGNLDPTNPTAWAEAMRNLRAGIRGVEREYA